MFKLWNVNCVCYYYYVVACVITYHLLLLQMYHGHLCVFLQLMKSSLVLFAGLGGEVSRLWHSVGSDRKKVIKYYFLANDARDDDFSEIKKYVFKINSATLLLFFGSSLHHHLRFFFNIKILLFYALASFFIFIIFLFYYYNFLFCCLLVVSLIVSVLSVLRAEFV